MDREVLDSIITESINSVLTEDMFDESHKNDVAHLIKHYLGKNKHFSDKQRHKKNKRKLRKLANGGKEYYDYDDYQIKNKKISAGDASSIRNTIDTEKTNIAAVARELFPDHTEEGAQSQLRKILNGERPMTKKLASKIEKMISAGQIAVK